VRLAPLSSDGLVDGCCGVWGRSPGVVGMGSGARGRRLNHDRPSRASGRRHDAARSRQAVGRRHTTRFLGRRRLGSTSRWLGALRPCRWLLQDREAPETLKQAHHRHHSIRLSLTPMGEAHLHGAAPLVSFKACLMASAKAVLS
jgi:hypothetical protein